MQGIHQPDIQPELWIQEKTKHQTDYQRRNHHRNQGQGGEQSTKFRYAVQNQGQSDSNDDFQSNGTSHKDKRFCHGIHKFRVLEHIDIVLQSYEHIFTA